MFLRRLASGEGAPGKEGLARCVVLTEVGEQSPYYGAVRVLKQMGADQVLRFRPDKLDAVFAKLKKIRPGAVVVVIKPQSLDVHFQFRLPGAGLAPG